MILEIEEGKMPAEAIDEDVKTVEMEVALYVRESEQTETDNGKD